MKGSPIIATAITIVVLLGLYLGMRAVILPESPKAQASDSHAGHTHAAPKKSTNGHDDSALETDFELYFSSVPKSVKITQPSLNKEVLSTTEIDSTEWNGTGTVNLDGHHIELQVEVEWLSASEMNFVQLIVSPASHASREKTLRSDGDISDIAELSW